MLSRSASRPNERARPRSSRAGGRRSSVMLRTSSDGLDDTQPHPLPPAARHGGVVVHQGLRRTRPGGAVRPGSHPARRAARGAAGAAPPPVPPPKRLAALLQLLAGAAAPPPRARPGSATHAEDLRVAGVDGPGSPGRAVHASQRAVCSSRCRRAKRWMTPDSAPYIARARRSAPLTNGVTTEAEPSRSPSTTVSHTTRGSSVGRSPGPSVSTRSPAPTRPRTDRYGPRSTAAPRRRRVDRASGWIAAPVSPAASAVPTLTRRRPSARSHAGPR